MKSIHWIGGGLGLAIIGFGVWWFVIKKKSASDLWKAGIKKATKKTTTTINTPVPKPGVAAPSSAQSFLSFSSTPSPPVTGKEPAKTSPPKKQSWMDSITSSLEGAVAKVGTAALSKAADVGSAAAEKAASKALSWLGL